eukprot:364816-Chlamydomonas_euryale.AAC.2
MHRTLLSSAARQARSSAIRCAVCRLTEKPHTVEQSFPCLSPHDKQVTHEAQNGMSCMAYH